MSTIDEKLGGLEGGHGKKSKMQELTENSPSGLKGLMMNRYATTVAISIGFGGLLYGYLSAWGPHVWPMKQLPAVFGDLYHIPVPS